MKAKNRCRFIKTGPGVLFAIFSMLCDHYEGTPLDITNDMGAGAFKMPYRLSPLTFEVDGKTYFNERPISTQQEWFCLFVSKCVSMPDAIGGSNFWFGVDDANMTGVFNQFNNLIITTITDKVPASYAEGGDCVTFSRNSPFWILQLADMGCPMP